MKIVQADFLENVGKEGDVRAEIALLFPLAIR